ncbi:hypothetical protein ACQKGC_18105 [Allorhizobium pseudoryzae]|uniref:hypothetical protein n=1 Tax=Allorhizobium pseudoryzae TaxID=379684 RepID=UPI003CFE6A9B
MSDSGKKHLVAVRAGDTSLHAAWLDHPYAERSFDCLVSYYSQAAFERHRPEEGVFAALVKGGKWDGLYRSFQQLALDLDVYDYVWLPDDDIATTGAAIEQIFALSRRYDLALSQPALTQGSYYSYFPLLQCRAFRLRYTNLVEIMVPCLNRAMLKRALPLFENTMTGFGLDYVWCRWPESGPYRSAILDAVAVHHTRPVGKHLKSVVAGHGRDEEAELQARFQIASRTIPISYAGVTADGTPIDGRYRMALSMLRSWLGDIGGFKDPKLARKQALQTFRRQFVKPLDLSPLDPPRAG